MELPRGMSRTAKYGEFTEEETQARMDYLFSHLSPADAAKVRAVMPQSDELRVGMLAPDGPGFLIGGDQTTLFEAIAEAERRVYGAEAMHSRCVLNFGSAT